MTVCFAADERRNAGITVCCCSAICVYRHHALAFRIVPSSLFTISHYPAFHALSGARAKRSRVMTGCVNWFIALLPRLRFFHILYYSPV